MTTIRIPVGQLIDGYLGEYREPGTIFLLSRGTYYTKGAFAFPDNDLCMLAPGCSIVGEGSFGTRIELDAAFSHVYKGQDTVYVEALTAGSRTNGASDSIRMSGFTLSLRFSNLPTVGIHVWSGETTIEDVRVESVYGSRMAFGPVREGFGILVNNSAGVIGTHDGGNAIRGCTVDMRRVEGENYSTGIYMGTVRRFGIPLLRSIVTDCEVISVDGHCGLAFNDHVDIEKCHVHGVRRAIFADTSPIRNSRVQNVVAHDVGWAMELRSSKTEDVRCGILVERCFFSFRPVDGWSQAMLMSDDSNKGASMDAIAVDNCTFVQTPGGNASKGRSNGSAIKAVISTNNRWLGNWQDPVIQNGAGRWV